MVYNALGISESAVATISVDKLHLYSGVTGGGAAPNVGPSFNSSLGPYERNMQRRAKHAQKYFTYEEAKDSGVITAAVAANPQYGVESLRLVEIVPELSHLG